MEKPLINRVAQSSLITLNLEDWFPESRITAFDLKDHLFHGLILREKEFRDALKGTDWSAYQGAVLCVHCSTDAILPVWAFMLVASAAAPYAQDVYCGTPEAYISDYYRQKIVQADIEPYRDQRLVIKGCSQKPVPPSAYLDITRRLAPVAQSILYGEPCSTVPVYKRPKS